MATAVAAAAAVAARTETTPYLKQAMDVDPIGN
jgi:hypothetical protein